MFRFCVPGKGGKDPFVCCVCAAGVVGQSRIQCYVYCVGRGGGEKGEGGGLHCFFTATAQSRGFGRDMCCALYISLGLVCAWKPAIVVCACCARLA